MSAAVSAIENPILEVLHSTTPIRGFTHNFYRYPAATSPELVREIVLRFSNIGDHIIDPFMGGGTTIIEALAHGRRAIGFDLNPLAVFVTRTKTTPLAPRDWARIDLWRNSSPFAQASNNNTKDRRLANLPEELLAPLSSALCQLGSLDSTRQRAFVRCALLRTTQWALESQDTFPNIEAFNAKFNQVVRTMHAGLQALVDAARGHGITKTELLSRRRIIRASADNSEIYERLIQINGKVRLVVTSPPYPGVHVLYHRWQVRGRRETAAPFWIARHRDGFGPSYYTMGGRSEVGQARYFERLTNAYRALLPLLARDALVVQLVAFTRQDEQLPFFLSAMERAGYTAVPQFTDLNTPFVRKVPNRRWYVRGKDLDASREHLLFHTPAR